MSDLVKTQKFSSVEELEASSGSENFISYVPDGTTIYRFLIEPDEWMVYREFYDQSKSRFFPVSDAYETPKKANVSKRALTAALVVEDDEVVPLKIPMMAYSDLLGYYERYGTLLDRDYEITKRGSGLKTNYKAYPCDVMKRPLSKYEAPDLHDALESWARDAVAEYSDEVVDDDDEEDEPPVRKKRTAGRPPSKDDDGPPFVTASERDDHLEMLKQMLVDDDDAFADMDHDELDEHLAMLGKESRAKNPAVKAKLLKRVVQS